MENPSKDCNKKPAPTTPRSIEELQEASEHLHYEKWMMQSAVQEFAVAQQTLASAQQATAAAQVKVNAFLEDCVIHARVLMEFLYTDEPKRDDDVVAAKFFDTPEQWTSVRKPFDKLSEELKKVKGRTGKEIAHLTFARNQIILEMKKWQLGKIVQELLEQFDVFLKHVPKNKLSSKWNQQPKS